MEENCIFASKRLRELLLKQNPHVSEPEAVRKYGNHHDQDET